MNLRFSLELILIFSFKYWKNIKIFLLIILKNIKVFPYITRKIQRFCPYEPENKQISTGKFKDFFLKILEKYLTEKIKKLYILCECFILNPVPNIPSGEILQNPAGILQILRIFVANFESDFVSE